MTDDSLQQNTYMKEGFSLKVTTRHVADDRGHLDNVCIELTIIIIIIIIIIGIHKTHPI